MPDCRKCGAYTKYYNGLCYSCYKNPKAGFVYKGLSVRPDGRVKEYVGSTTRNPSKRFREHFNEVRKSNSKTWVGKGKWFEPTEVMWSNNARKAEKTIKQAKRRGFFSSLFQ